MTPGARIAAAIAILDEMAAGLAAEQALTRWARRSRFAGSKDRAAIRDHVFDVLRQRPAAAHYGGGDSGRALMIGLLRLQGADPSPLFDGEGHAPLPLTAVERDSPAAPRDRAVRWCLPAWLVPDFKASLGADAEATARALQDRAPVCLRVNRARIGREAAQEILRSDEIETVSNALAETALTVTDGARRIRTSRAFSEGYVELQDASSQAVAALLPPGGRVLDYCAGGGGKALALAAVPGREVLAHDIDPDRMSDLPARAARAGANIGQVATADLAGAGPFDAVLCDAPCSGSGAWRRAPEGKWTLTPERLQHLTQIQDEILDRAAALATPDGLLAYATCSILSRENEERIDAFLARHPEWSCRRMVRFPVAALGDGFFTAHLTRERS